MTWSTRHATMMDAERIYDNLWERGAEELAAFGISKASWVVKCLCMIAMRCCVVFLKDDVPVAILGVEKVGVSGRTWFQATKDAERDMRGLTRYVRKMIPSLADAVGLKQAALHSLCISPLASRWYECLGFKEDADYSGAFYGGRQERRFTRAWS